MLIKIDINYVSKPGPGATLNDSPQPHASLILGFLKTNLELVDKCIVNIPSE